MKQEISWRYKLLGLVFSFVGLLIFGQTIRLQLSPSVPAFLEQGESYAGGVTKITPPRGQIYDREGYLLAGNKTVYEVGLELRYVVDPEAIAIAANGVLGMDYDKALKLASTSSEDKSYVPLARAVPANKVTVLQDYMNLGTENSVGSTNMPSLEGMVFRPYLTRSYPEKDMASPVLGFVSSEGIGYYGVEQFYHYLLAGVPQDVWVPYNPNRVAEIPEIPPGANLILTIDREIQTMAEEELDESVKRYKAKAGTVVIMDPKTGDILAMASTPRLDLNQYWRYAEIYPDKTPFNRATSKAFEPGSVFKVFTVAAALDSGTITPETTFTDTGVFKIGGLTIHNWDNGAWGTQDMTGCLQHSLNVCLAWIGQKTGADTFYKYMEAFGFGHFTGVDIAGEATGRLKQPGDNDWFPGDLGTNTFGQGISVTPVQLMQAASAIANKGEMMVPHIVSAIADNGNQFNIHPQVAGQPISAETADTLLEMLANSLEEEASDALVYGYRVAGKTGTGEIPTEYGYTTYKTNASFLGFGPVDDPQFIIYVWLEEPATIWGSLTAAPTFSLIAQRLVVLMDLPPDTVRMSLNK